MKGWIVIRSLMLSALTASLASGAVAQGFIQYYPTPPGNTQFIKNFYQRPDGGYVIPMVNIQPLGLHWIEVGLDGGMDTVRSRSEDYLATHSVAFFPDGSWVNGWSVSADQLIQVSKFNPAGDTAWKNSYNFPFDELHIELIRPYPDGSMLVRAFCVDPDQFSERGLLFKLSPTGVLLWSTVFPDINGFFYNQTTSDGGVIHRGAFASGADERNLVRLDANGDTVWVYSVPSGSFYSNGASLFNRIVVADHPDGSASAVVNTSHLHKISPDGTMAWDVDVKQETGLDIEKIQYLVACSNGDYIAALRATVTGPAPYDQIHLVRVNAAGTVVWTKSVPSWSGPALWLDVAKGFEQPDGMLVFTGTSANGIFLLKTDANGQVYPFSVEGDLRRDVNEDCLQDAGDETLAGWVVGAQALDGSLHFTTTDSLGRYAVSDLDTGSYQIFLSPVNYLWQPCGGVPVIDLPTPEGFDKDTVPLLVDAVADCPVMSVDVTAPILRRCFSNTYYVSYCNFGNLMADSTVVTIILDPLLDFNSASIPHTQNGQELSFVLGPTPPNTCGDFTFNATPNCDLTELGQTLCVSAAITPDTLCGSWPGWSGALVELGVNCETDSVEFRITNKGAGAMQTPLPFIVVDDHVITRQGNFQLQPGASEPIRVPATGGTIRMFANQEPGFPLSAAQPTVATEGCGVDSAGLFSTGWVNQWGNYTGSPFSDRYCRTVIGSYDPNDKQAQPIGFHPEHIIEPGQPLDYLIRFQNTGTDTAFTVMIRDTLSEWLDPASVRPGPASHPYSWYLSGANILTFVFHPIALPDSNVNEPASNGFVQFSIRQRGDVPLGSLIENRAGIYFDFNEPVITNTVFHTVDVIVLDTLLTSNYKSIPEGTTLVLRPNPARDQVWVSLPEAAAGPFQMTVSDIFGRPVRRQELAGPAGSLFLDNLPAGCYFVQVRDAKGRWVGSGKFVKE